MDSRQERPRQCKAEGYAARYDVSRGAAVGPDKGRQGTVQSEHKTVAEAFAALDSIASDMAQTGVPGDAIELVVVDEHGQVVPRPGTH